MWFQLDSIPPWACLFAGRTQPNQQLEQIVFICAARQQAPKDPSSKWTIWSHTFTCLCSTVWQSVQPLFFIHSWLYNLLCFCVWCPTCRKCVQSAQMVMRHFISSLQRVNPGLIVLLSIRSVQHAWGRGCVMVSGKPCEGVCFDPLYSNVLWTQNNPRKICKLIWNKSAILEQSKTV